MVCRSEADWNAFHPTNAVTMATHRDDPAADIFVEDDFSPEQDEHAAIPEGLSLRSSRVPHMRENPSLLTSLTLTLNSVYAIEA